MKKLLLVCVLFVGAFAGKLVEPKEYGSLVVSNFNFAYASKSKECLELTIKEKIDFLSLYNRGLVVVNGSVIVGEYGDIIEAVEATSNGNVISYNFATSQQACNVVKEYYAKEDKKAKK